MNEHIVVSVSGVRNLEQQPLVIDNIEVDIMLNPLYCTEGDIRNEFMEEDSTAYTARIRQVIFNGSREIDHFLSMYGLQASLSSKQLFMIKRDYVVCYGIYHLGATLNLDYLSSQNKEKFMGDVKVKLSSSSDPAFLLAKVDDARQCLAGIKALFEQWNSLPSMMNIFVKGEWNSSSRRGEREWWRQDPAQPVPIAATKKYNNSTGTNQKIGGVNTSYYGQYLQE